MLRRTLTILALVMAPLVTPPALAAPLALRQVQPFPIAEMMRATALDEVFTQFGPTIAASARTEDITADEIFLRHWEATATAVFDARRLHRQLAAALDGRFSSDEQAVLGAFYHSAFGRRISELERAVALLDADQQGAAIDAGKLLVAGAEATRGAQLDRLMTLVSAEISGAMVGQSVRAMLVGMSVAHQQGDIEVPWEEIDQQVTAMMPSLLADVASGQQAMMAYAYRNLTDAELDRYIAFLETPSAQKFYAVATFAVGRIVTEGMSRFGEAFAARMASVNI